MNSQKIVDKFIAMWDMNGLESIVNISEGERAAVVSALKGEKIQWRNPIQYMILRAKLNSQRCYEIYFFESEMDKDELVLLFNDRPQLMADTIRRIGQQLYSERRERAPVIT